MYLYLVFFVLSIFAFCDIWVKQEKHTLMYKLVFIQVLLFLFIISAFRFERGTDWPNYQNYFLASFWGFDGWMEPGFTLLNKLVYLISINYSVMVFTITSIVYIIKPTVIYRLAPYPFVVLFTWYVINIADIFPIRQTIATALVLYSIFFVVKRQFIYFLIIIIFAATFHYTALIFIITYFFARINISRVFAVTAFVGSFIIAMGAEGLISNLLSGISTPIIQERIAEYLSGGTDETFGSIYSTREILIRGFINRGLIMFVLFGFLNAFRKEDAIFNCWVNMFVFSSVFYAILCSVNPALGRLVLYFDISQLFVFSYIFKLKMTSASRLIIWGLLVSYFLYRFRGVINNYYELYVPYKSIFWNTDMKVVW